MVQCLVAGCVLRFGLTWDASVGAFFCAALVAIAATDAERQVIPNRVVLPAAAVVLAANTILHPSVEWLAAAYPSVRVIRLEPQRPRRSVVLEGEALRRRFEEYLDAREPEAVAEEAA